METVSSEMEMLIKPRPLPPLPPLGYRRCHGDGFPAPPQRPPRSSAADLPVRLMIDQHVNVIIDVYHNDAQIASSKIGEACIPLDRLVQLLDKLVQDGKYNIEVLYEELEAFVEAGNGFIILHADLCKMIPFPKMMRLIADELKERYDEEIVKVEKMRTIIARAFIGAVPVVAIAVSASLLAKATGGLYFALATLVAAPLSLIKFHVDTSEAARKAEEDALKRKCEGAAAMRGLAYSFECLINDLTQTLPFYEELMDTVEDFKKKIKLMIDEQHQHTHEMESNMRREVTDLKWKVEINKRKAEKIQDRAEDVKKSAANAAKDVAVLNIVKDLDELLKYRP